ncbi:MAG: hypothetical protein JNN30_19935 [Rhodanobacteraceae bacterium]|nr:hypothetical protein [Rhodanobacteraceae bacterium]
MNALPALTSTGSNFRARLYWVWQAWRLRNAAAIDMAGSVEVLNGFAAVERRYGADLLCKLMQAVSHGTPGLVAESAAQVRVRLLRELSPQTSMVVLNAGQQVIGGYAWGRVDHGAQSLVSLRRLPSLAALDERCWGALAAAIGDRRTLVLHEIGLDSRCRYGFSPLKQLLKPLFDLGAAQAARRALWWVPRTSPLFGLSRAFGARQVGTDDSIAFFVHHNVATIARILNALPASEISTLLARIAPPRTASAQVIVLPTPATARALDAARTKAPMLKAAPKPKSGPTVTTSTSSAAAIVTASYPGFAPRAGARVACNAAVASAKRGSDLRPRPEPALTSSVDSARVNAAGRQRIGADSPLLLLPRRLAMLFHRQGR